MLRNTQIRRLFSTTMRHPNWSPDERVGERLRSNKKLKALITDHGGTSVDFGCRSPTIALQKIFSKFHVPITRTEACKFNGLSKKLHIKQTLSIPTISNQWRIVYNRLPDDKSVDQLYKEFTPTLIESLPMYSRVIPEWLKVLPVIRKDFDLKIGSTTAYSRVIMNALTKLSTQQGYTPDYLVTADDPRLPKDNNNEPMGRPHQYMMELNRVGLNLPVGENKYIAKVGDTESDILEGLNFGCWTIGVIDTSAYMGLSPEELFHLKENNPREYRTATISVKDKLIKAHYIIKDMSELPYILEQINWRLSRGDNPSKL